MFVNFDADDGAVGLGERAELAVALALDEDRAAPALAAALEAPGPEPRLRAVEAARWR